MKQFPKKLNDPPKQYRGVPFWSWNDRLDPEFLKWQIREMDRAGLGGYFMHARGGLRTKYMGEGWMQCIDSCIEEGNKLGMSSWCYDEEGWPSGFAGGKVPALGIEYHVKWLEPERITNGIVQVEDSVLGAYSLDASGALCRLSLKEAADSIVKGVLNQEPVCKRALSERAVCELADREILVIRQKSSPYYFDILNKDAVKAFINFTHEEYLQRFKEHFGKGMPGFFTDEPQYSIAGIPWSHVIPEAFHLKHGYDILDVLPALFVECKGYQQIRYDYWSVVSELYVQSFGKQIYEWCEEHHCNLTGHVMMEDTLHSQMVSTAGAMPFYEYMQIPGIDWLGRHISNPVIPRQVSSVANQLGKPFILSEMFALCGWDVSFEELKWIAEWQYVNGVNLMCQHLEGYTLEGSRKRDYPPSMFYHQSWWDEYKGFNDYFARLGMLLSDGSNVCDVLLLHPMKSGWIAYNHSNTPGLQKLDKDFARATETLAGLHIDHHYGDETIIGKYGKVYANKFAVGLYEYSVVVIPSMLTIDKYTLQLLNEFSNNGGIIISIGDFPNLVDGRESDALAAFKSKVVCIGEDSYKLYSLLKDAGAALLSISDSGGEIASIQSRVIGFNGSRAYFMVNQSQKETYKATVKTKANSSVGMLNIETGKVEKTNCKPVDGIITMELEFLPMQSYVVVTGEAAEIGTSPADEFDTSPVDENPSDVEIIIPEKAWDIETEELNSLTLDYCEYRINHGEWHSTVPVIKLMNILLQLRSNCDVAMKFSFDVEMELDKNREFILAVEAADELRITVNGKIIKYSDIGWWKDSAFKKIDIKPYVKKGSNEVILERRFYQNQKVYDVLFGENVLETEKNKLTYDTELESIYVIGDFGVVSKSGYTEEERKALFTEGPFIIVDQPRKTTNGQLTQQGFCFFAGSLKLSQNLHFPGNSTKSEKSAKSGKRILLDIGKPDAPVSKLFINDQPVKAFMWAPYKADITEFVREGDNKLTLQLFAGNRNLLGPHHHKDGELYFVAPYNFYDNNEYTSDTEKGTWSDRYCFVRFGV